MKQYVKVPLRIISEYVNLNSFGQDIFFFFSFQNLKKDEILNFIYRLRQVYICISVNGV